ERARLGEEDREQERDRGHRLLAARQQRQALGRLARRRDLDLDAEQVLLAGGDRGLGLGELVGVLGSVAVTRPRDAGEARDPLLLLDEPQAPAATGEQLRGELLEVARGRVERRLERLVDLPV